MKLVFLACIVALVAGQACAKPELPVTRQSMHTPTGGSTRSLFMKNRANRLKQAASNKFSAANYARAHPSPGGEANAQDIQERVKEAIAKAKSFSTVKKQSRSQKFAADVSAAIYEKSILPREDVKSIPGATVNAQKIKERAQAAVARAKGSPTTWKAWEERVKEKMAEKELAKTAAKVVNPQKTQNFYNQPRMYHPRQDLRQEIAAEERKFIPKTVPMQRQEVLAKQQSTHHHQEPKTVHFPGAVSNRVMQEEVKSFVPSAMAQWNEEDIQKFMQLSEEQKAKFSEMVKEKAQQSGSMYQPFAFP